MSAPSTGRAIPGVYWSAVCPTCGKTVAISHAEPDLETPVPCMCGGLAGYMWRLADPDPQTSTPGPPEERARAYDSLEDERSGPDPLPDPVPLGLVLDRPLVVFDLETTGVDTKTCRIVEICLVRVNLDQTTDTWSARVNPGQPIPAEASAIHGIMDDDVRDCPRFATYAGRVLAFLADCDLAGFNIRNYDLKVLLAELARCDLTLPLEGLRLVDALSIYHRREPRNLSAAVKLYLGRDHTEAHGAEGDVFATLDVLAAQLARYDDLPRTVGELHTLFAPEGSIDLEGRFRLGEDGRIMFTFGKYKDWSLDEVAMAKPDYLRWMLSQDFFDDCKAIIRAAL